MESARYPQLSAREESALRDAVVREALLRGMDNPLCAANETSSRITEGLMEGPDGSPKQDTFVDDGMVTDGTRHRLGRTGAAIVQMDYNGRLGGGSPQNALQIGKKS